MIDYGFYVRHLVHVYGCVMHAYTRTGTKTHTLTLQPIPMHANVLSVLTKKIAVCIKQSHQHTVHKQHIPLLTHFCFSSRAKHSHSHTRVHAHTHKLHTSTSASQKKRGKKIRVNFQSLLLLFSLRPPVENTGRNRGEETGC